MILIMKMRLLQTLALLVAVSLAQTPSDPCPAQWELSRLSQTTRTLEITSTADQISESYVLTFSGSFFSRAPLAIITTPMLDVSSFSAVDYRIIPQVSSTSVVVAFQSNSMKWKSVKFTIWLTTRDDLFIGTIVHENFQPTAATSPIAITANTSAPVGYYQDNSTIYLNYINGIKATSAQKVYEVSTSSVSRSASTYTVEVTVNPNTNLTYLRLDYIIYNTNLSLFASGGGFYSNTNIFNPIYMKVHGNFLPVNYNLMGLQGIRIANQTQISLNLDIDRDNILTISTTAILSAANIVYLTIGQKTNLVCAACPEKFIYRESCIDSCPEQAYPYASYVTGGSSCLTCSPKVFEVINPQNSGCICLSGYSFNSRRQCALTLTTTTSVTTVTTTTNSSINNSSSSNSTSITIIPLACPGNSIVFNGNCINCTNGLYKNGISCLPCAANCSICASSTTCATCNNRFVLNPLATVCLPEVLLCADGFYQSSGACQPCPSSCRTCNEPFKCLTCKQDDILDPSNTLCTAPRTSCPANQTLTAIGTCVCDSLSMLITTGVCFKCVQGSYLRDKNCVPCTTPDCMNCNMSDICLKCISGYKLLPSGQCSLIVTEPTCNQTSILLPNGTCFKCLGGSYKSGNSCFPCADDACIACISNTSCQTCLPTFTLSPNGRTCQCGLNQAKANERCECDQFSLRAANQTCVRCTPGSYLSITDTDRKCLSCVPGCLECVNGSSCSRCINLLVYSSASNSCLAPVCPSGASFLNGVCVCSGLNVLTNNECLPCPSAEFKDGSACRKCLDNCVRCSSTNSCLECRSEYTFNSTTSRCECQAPNHIINGQCQACQQGLVFSNLLLNCVTPSVITSNDTLCVLDGFGVCQCDNSSILVGEKCVKCGAATYKAQNKCDQCPLNCQKCVDASSCQLCNLGTSFDSISKSCILPTGACRINEEIVDGKCQCNNRSIIATDGSCVFCGNALYPNPSKSSCFNCIAKCDVCYNSSGCDICALGYEGPLCNRCALNYDSKGGFCILNMCGNGVTDRNVNETCDDNNRVEGDGCSAFCQIENGYACQPNSNGISVCQQIFRLASSKVTSSGIFLTYDTLQGNPSQIGSPVVTQGPVPSAIQANTNDKNQKIFFMDYCGALPPANVSMKTSINGNQPAQYNLVYDLLDKKQVIQ